jgi:hypothetical protein
MQTGLATVRKPNVAFGQRPTERDNDRQSRLSRPQGWSGNQLWVTELARMEIIVKCRQYRAINHHLYLQCCQSAVISGVSALAYRQNRAADLDPCVASR